MIVYQLGGPDEKVFTRLKDAREYAREMGFEDYYIDRCKLARPSAEVLIDVINSQGGSWCSERYETVEAKGFWQDIKNDRV